MLRELLVLITSMDRIVRTGKSWMQSVHSFIQFDELAAMSSIFQPNFVQNWMQME